MPGRESRGWFPGSDSAFQIQHFRKFKRFGLFVVFSLGAVVAGDVAFAVADIGGVAEFTARHFAFGTGEAAVCVRLIQPGDCGSDVFKFLIDVVRDFGESDNQAEYSDGGHQNQFGRDNETGFVAGEFGEDIVHGGFFQ